MRGLKEELSADIEKASIPFSGPSDPPNIEDLLPGCSEKIRAIREQIRKVGPTMAPTFLTGESGTGKECAAQAIHAVSLRKEKPLVAANCGAISPQLIQSELFGHEKGSFTGAVREHAGYFEQANGGTLFLDELAEMPLDLQVNLLRVIETGRFRRVGGTQEHKADFRLIAATNRDPYEAVEEGYLREDLFYRIQVFHISMPPLRGREEDVELIANQMLDGHNRSAGARKRFSAESMQVLKRYHWPGNIRELKNVVYRSFIVSSDTVQRADLPSHLIHSEELVSRAEAPEVGTTIAQMEEELIIRTLHQCGGRREEAARLLGISSKTLYNRLRDYRRRGKLRD